MDHATELVFIYLSPGVGIDGGGFGIDGAGHVHRIGPWTPDLIADLEVGAGMIARAGKIQDAEMSKELQTLGEKMVVARVREIQHSAIAKV